MTPEAPEKLAFYRSIFPDTLYLVPEVVTEVADSDANPAVASANTAVLGANNAAVKATAVVAEAKTTVADVKAAAAGANTTPVAPNTTGVKANAGGAVEITTTTAQQSRGDGSGVLVVQRLAPADFGKLNQNPFWQKFLQFLKLDWTTVRFVNVLTPEPLALESLRAAVPQATRMLLFGDNLVMPMPPTLPKYQVLEGKTMRVLMAHAVADLDDERKRALMTALPGLMK